MMLSHGSLMPRMELLVTEQTQTISLTPRTDGYTLPICLARRSQRDSHKLQGNGSTRLEEHSPQSPMESRQWQVSGDSQGHGLWLRMDLMRPLAVDHLESGRLSTAI